MHRQGAPVCRAGDIQSADRLSRTRAGSGAIRSAALQADAAENADADGDKSPHTHPYVDGHSNSYADGYSYANTDKHTHVHRHGHANANGYGHVNPDARGAGHQHY